MRSTVVRPVADPEVDEDGKVLLASECINGGEYRTTGSEVPKSRCGGSSPVTPEAVDTENPPDARQPVEQNKEPAESWEVEPSLEQDPSASEGSSRLHQRLRYRLYGKQTVPFTPEAPALHVLRAGGEDQEKDEAVFEWIHGLKLLQHRQLKVLMQEEASRLQHGQFAVEEAKVLKEMSDSIKHLEHDLEVLQQRKQEGCRIKSLQLTEDGEVLQTQTVSLDVVRRELEEWIPAFKHEVETILESGAMERIDDEKYKQLLREHPNLERLPTLAVATVKPPFKRKGRVVVCGNCSTKERKEDETRPVSGWCRHGGNSVSTRPCGTTQSASRKHRCEGCFFASTKTKCTEEANHLRSPSPVETDETGESFREMAGAQGAIRLCGVALGLELFS